MTESKRNKATSTSAPTPPVRQPPPLNRSLTVAAASKLKQLITMCDLITNDARWIDSTPLQSAQELAVMNTIVNLLRDFGFGAKPDPDDITLSMSLMELEDAPMHSLSPRFQQLKLGFEQMPLYPSKPKGIERRINQALHAAGEPSMRVIFSDWKVDRSTIPPTRRFVTDKDRVEMMRQHQKQLNDLRVRKPALFVKVNKILTELNMCDPRKGAPKLLPAIVDGSRLSQRVGVPDNLSALGYTRPRES